MRGRPDGLELADRATLAALDGRLERKYIGIGGGSDTVDVHFHRHQRLHKVRSLGSGVRPNRPSERETDHEDLFAEAISQPFEEGHGVGHHCVDADAFGLLRSPQRAPAATLVPVDNRELLLQPEEALEAAGLVHHRKAGALLDKQEQRVGGVHPMQCGSTSRASKWTSSRSSMAIGISP